jgi:prephenate dehydrogenase
MTKIGIIGYGKFGQLLHKILSEHASNLKILCYDLNSNLCANTLEEILKTDIIIPAVPIAALKQIAELLNGKLNKQQLVIDVSSVKIYSKELLMELSSQTQIILTHPMFGPATYFKREQSHPPLFGLNINLENLSAESNTYQKIRQILTDSGLIIHELTSNEHDLQTAQFQFTSLFVALSLKELDIQSSPIATESYRALQAFQDLIAVDRELLKNIYQYNPYCKDQLNQIEKSFNDLKLFLKE